MKTQTLDPPIDRDIGSNVIRVSNAVYRLLRAHQRAHESLLLTLDRLLQRELKAYQKRREQKAG